MKIAVVGSRNCFPSEAMLAKYLFEAEEIISGGAKGADTCAARYAEKHGIKVTEYAPEYARYGRGATHVRNKKIVDSADQVVAFWDGQSKGTQSVIKYAQKSNKPCVIVLEAK